MRKIFHFNHGTGDHNPRLIYFISKHSVPSQNLIMREPLHDMHATDRCERHQVRVRTKGLHSCPADSEVGVNDSAPVQVDLDCDKGIYSMLPAADASGTNVEHFRSLFKVPSILKQIKCPIVHIDADSTEYYGELWPYKMRMYFLNFRHFSHSFTCI